MSTSQLLLGLPSGLQMRKPNGNCSFRGFYLRYFSFSYHHYLDPPAPSRLTTKHLFCKIGDSLLALVISDTIIPCRTAPLTHSHPAKSILRNGASRYTYRKRLHDYRLTFHPNAPERFLRVHAAQPQSPAKMAVTYFR